MSGTVTAPAAARLNNRVQNISVHTANFRSLYLTLLRSADFVDPILAKGPGCYLFKKDLERPYRQIPVDLNDYIFLGYRWQDLLYISSLFSVWPPRGDPRTTNTTAHFFRTSFHFDRVNYNDDFRGVEASYDEAVVAFTHLGQLFTNLDLESSPTKDCLPSTRMIFLGLTYETVVVTLEKLHQTSQLLCYWLSS